MAQENPLVIDHAGSWSVSGPIAPTFAVEIRAADRPAVTNLANQLFDALRRMPEFAPPAGFQVIPYARVTPEHFNQTAGSASIVYASQYIRVNLAPWERKGAVVTPNERDTAAAIEIKVNTLEPLLGSEIGDDWKDGQGAFVRNAPQPGETIHGHPVYESGNQKWIMIFRSAAPVMAPVSRGRYMKVKIRNLEERLAKARKNRAAVPAGVPASVVATIDDAIGQLRNALQENQKQLDAMSPDERIAAAFVESDRDDEATEFTDGPDNAITYFNPALMDARQGVATPQIIAISITSDEDQWPGMSDKLSQELDWSALETFVHQ